MSFSRLSGLTIALCFGVVVLLGAPALLRAQAFGTINGFVTDPSGAVVPAANVTATETQRGTTTSTVTNAEGYYFFPALEPGPYTLAFEKAGFQRYLRENLTLTVSQNLRVDGVLQVGAVTQSVTVSGEAALVDTLSPVVSGLVDDRRVVDLPLNGRNVIGLAVTVPGVTNVNAPQNMTDARSGPLMDVNGGVPAPTFSYSMALTL